MAIGNVKLMTRAEYSAHRGVSRKAVTVAVQQGRISLLKGDLIDPDIADAQWAKNTRAKAGAKRPAPAPSKPPENTSIAPPGDAGGHVDADDYDTSRARREAAEADLSEMERDKQRGELLEVGAVRSMLARLAGSAQQALTQMPARLGPLLAAETDPFRCTQLIEAEADAVLRQIVDGCA